MGRKTVTPNPFKGGYSEVTASKIAKVIIPDKLKCTRCHKWKGTTNYSNKQLADLRYKIFTHGHAATEDGSGIKCRVCTGQQIVEMHCYMCNRTKGLDEFAKAQRSDPDHAKCLKCMDNQLNTEPTAPPALPQLDEAEDDDSDSDKSNPYEDDDEDDEVGLGAGLSKLSVKADTNTTSCSGSTVAKSEVSGGVSLGKAFDDVPVQDVWESQTWAKAASVDRGGEESSRTRTEQAFPVFNRHAYGHPSRSSSVTSKTMSFTSESGPSRSRSVASAVTQNNVRSKAWAKIPAKKPATRPKVVESDEENEEVSSGDEDEEIPI